VVAILTRLALMTAVSETRLILVLILTALVRMATLPLQEVLATLPVLVTTPDRLEEVIPTLQDHTIAV